MLNTPFVPMFHDLENEYSRRVKIKRGTSFYFFLNDACCPPSLAWQIHTLLEHWNIGTKRLKSLIHKVKSCSKHFWILEQTEQTTWNKPSSRSSTGLYTACRVVKNIFSHRELASPTGTGFARTGLAERDKASLAPQKRQNPHRVSPAGVACLKTRCAYLVRRLAI